MWVLEGSWTAAYFTGKITYALGSEVTHHRVYGDVLLPNSYILSTEIILFSFGFKSWDICI